MKRYIVIIVLFSGLIFLWYCHKIPSETNTNWILFTLDTLRADYLGCYGNPRVKTPNLDMISRESFVFTNASSESPWTIPSHASLMTSLYPRTHGAIYTHRKLEDKFDTAAEILGRCSYMCGAVVAALPTSTERGFHQGFEHFEDTNIALVRFCNEITEYAISWFSTKCKEPFFFWGHYYDPHRPYNPPHPFDKMYEPYTENDFDKYFKYSRDDSEEEQIKRQRIDQLGIEITPAIVNRALSLYSGETTLMDKEIGKLLIFLKQRGFYKNSIITFVADHGEYFGENNNYFRHDVDLGATVLHIPYMMRIPELRNIRLISEPVQLVDVLPTVLSFLHLYIDYTRFSGRKLKPLLTSRESLERKYLVSEFHPDEHKQFYCIQDEKMKYVRLLNRGNVKDMLYDLEGLHPENNIASENPDKTNEYKELLIKWLKETKGFDQKQEFSETEVMKDAMRALGYLE